MDKTALVNLDIERGAKVLESLDRAGLRLPVALWMYMPEYPDWRLVVSSPQFANLGPTERYGLLLDSLREAGVDREQRPPILVLPPSDPFIRDLRKIFGRARSVEGMRLGGQTIGDRFVEDAIVYRIS